MPQVSLAELAAQARSGSLISFPTDTVPALATRPDAAAQIYTAKGRDLNKSLILMAASAADLWPFAQGSTTELAVWSQVAQQFWPGPLTLVLPASDRVPSALNPTGLPTIGLRVPNWPIALRLLNQTGPLATTSINRSGQPPLEDLGAIAQEFPTVWTLPTPDWALPPVTQRQPSTVMQWQDSAWQILRPGAITRADLAKIQP